MQWFGKTEKKEKKKTVICHINPSFWFCQVTFSFVLQME